MQKMVKHAVFWVVIYISWTYMKSSRVHYSVYLIVNLLNVTIYMAAYYGLKHIQIPRFYDEKKFVKFGLSLLFSSILFYTIWRIAGELGFDELRKLRNLPFMQLVDYATQTVQFYSPAMALLVWDSHQERKKEQQRIQELEKEKLNTELKFLKAQLNPHFLFNTLNNLYSYVVTKSPKAPDMVLRLSGILDYVLYKSQQKCVPLKEELKAIENFIELEKIRYGERLKVTYESNGNLSLPVSPLLLLSIVENAFKHGASGDIDTPEIKINIEAGEYELKCMVWNTKSQLKGELNDGYKKGIGLSNIKQQLNLTYPNNYRLSIDNQKEMFTILLVIKP